MKSVHFFLKVILIRCVNSRDFLFDLLFFQVKLFFILFDYIFDVTSMHCQSSIMAIPPNLAVSSLNKICYSMVI